MKESNGILSATALGKKYLNKILTDPEGPVYAFLPSANPVKISAAMARLSRRGDDMRVILLDEFADAKKEEILGLFKRVVTGFGDDSVQQLVFLQFVVEDASNLLTKLLEWGRFAAYLEQSTRYIYFDKKDKNGRYKYYVPENLHGEVAASYISSMDSVFDLYSGIVHKLTEYLRSTIKKPASEAEYKAWLGSTRAQACDAARPVLPVATKSTVGIVAVAQSVENLVLRLASSNLPEASEKASQILREARKVIGPFLERADMPERGGAWIVHKQDTKSAIKELAGRYLPKFYIASDEVVLADYWPRDELDLVPEMLFEASNLPLAMIKNRVKSWPLAQKAEVFGAYVGSRLNRRHRPGRAMEKAHYEWQITADYGTFRDLQRHRVVDMMEWQKLSPAYGYDVPKLILEAGMDNDFRKCFEISGNLHAKMENAATEEVAQYATLLGHKMRYRFMMNARESFHFHELRTSPQGHPGYRRIVKTMHEILKSVHPRIADAMKFVNQGEDPELTRFAAELATQRKLALLENK